MNSPQVPCSDSIRIEICEDDMVSLYEEECYDIIEALLGHRTALITDWSDIWDFCPAAEDLERLSALMGRTVGDEKGVLWELARELRLKRTDQGLQPPRTNG